MDRFDGYSVNIFIDEDGEWVASLAELPAVSDFADSAEGALQELDIAWAAVKESYLAKEKAVPVAPARKQYSGRFNVRVDKRLHRDLAVEAAREGVSLNALVSRKHASSVHPGAKSVI